MYINAHRTGHVVRVDSVGLPRVTHAHSKGALPICAFVDIEQIANRLLEGVARIVQGLLHSGWEWLGREHVGLELLAAGCSRDHRDDRGMH
eukprot:m.329838 g.329838  ORF g.329838 m.329838 type:complete len:91 (+) comp27714_c0_seq2:4390-4662(+)